ncbi:type I secretion system permease/ATPase [Kaistia dalseonensis]|uniref:type I secretion system permease/ATPase n=1 Tax=Kaistia dalseonensis TaxID=410840 RepID=UPI00225A7A64|nr:type I secretion system permease/ATPase [Kaistia dalseonensis]MCX5493762.1 type I secretion system permease/ATPase [Kaistia dalseonensis]
MADERDLSSQDRLRRAIRLCRGELISVAAFSTVFNVLVLAGPIYMLQVYDRVLESRSVATLVALSLALVGAYALQAVIDIVRGRLLILIAGVFDKNVQQPVHDATIGLSILDRGSASALQPIRDVDAIRAFLMGSGPVGLMDLPWAPIFLVLCFLIHPLIGWIAAVGALILFCVALLAERSSRTQPHSAIRDGRLRYTMLESNRRNAETIVAMGLSGALAERWERSNADHLAAQHRTSATINGYTSLTRALRLLLQSAILGAGAYLVIHRDVTSGAMLASSIMMTRALAPIEQVIANWRGLIGAREALQRLASDLARGSRLVPQTSLAAPKHTVEVSHLVLAPPGSRSSILSDINFSLVAGDALAVIGPSGSGKTTLAKALLGIWHPLAGSVRLDGATPDQWDPVRLGPHVGYVPQSADIFPASIAENISRMSLEPDSDAIVKAAKAAGIHQLILRLPSGYDSQMDETNSALSAGQRQRLALARALYKDPFLLVLDEPNSNLDGEGEVALLEAVRAARSRGAIVVLMTHRPAAVAICNKVLLLAGGKQRAFGERDEILGKNLRQARPRAAGGPNRIEAAE